MVLPVSWGEPLCCMMIMDPKLEAKEWLVPRKFPEGYIFEVEVGAQPTETPVACLSFGFSLSFFYMFLCSFLLSFPLLPPVIPPSFPPMPVLSFMHPCSSPSIHPPNPPFLLLLYSLLQWQYVKIRSDTNLKLLFTFCRCQHKIIV